MKTKHFLTLFLLSFLVLSSNIKADTDGCCTRDTSCNFDCGGCWYSTIGAGYAWSSKAGIDNPDPNFWDASDQGYDSDLGKSAFFSIGFGRQFCEWMNFDATYSYYQTFHYQKYQTTTDTSAEGFTGNARTRFFDLDHQNILFTFSMDPKWSNFCCEFCGISVHPLFGAGIGMGINQVNNFHTVAFIEIPAINEDDDVGVGTTTSIGDRVTKVSFAWQVLAALRFEFPCTPFNVDIGYRYYNGGCFKGPDKIVSNTHSGQGGFNSLPSWKGHLKANEIFVSLGLCF